MSYLRERQLDVTPPLVRAIAHAYYESPFYRRRFEAAGVTPDSVGDASDLERLPLTRREDLAGDPWRLLAAPVTELAEVHASTGTTGESTVYVFYGWDDLAVRGLGPLVPGTGLGLGIRPGAVVVNALPYEVSVTGLAMHRALQDGVGACVVPAGKGGCYADPARTVRLLARLEAEYLVTTPSYALRLAEAAADVLAPVPGSAVDGRRPVALRALWLLGEGCPPAMRRRVEACWGAPALVYYGSLEAGPIGIECGARQGLHVATGFVHVEILPEPALAGPRGCRADGRAGAPPIGEIVVTTLWRRASPLVRFATGDLGAWVPGVCPCGVPGPRLVVHGRRRDCLPLGHGPTPGSAASGAVFVGEVEDAVLEAPEASAWFRLGWRGSTLVVTLPPPLDPGLTAAVERAVARRTGAACRVEAGPPLAFHGGKLDRWEAAP